MDFTTFSTQHLKTSIGMIMTELRVRAKDARNAAAGTVTVTTAKLSKQERADKREQAKQEYKDKRATYNAQPYGVKRVSDGKVLKRRFDNTKDATEAAVKLSLDMKAPAGYVVTDFTLA